MQRLLDGRNSFNSGSSHMKTGAAFILENEHWHPLLRNRQTYFRDLVASIAGSLSVAGVDDRKVPAAIKHMIDNKYLWHALNKIKRSGDVGSAIFVAANSLAHAGLPMSPENIQSVLRLLIEPETPMRRNPMVIVQELKTDPTFILDATNDPYIDPDIVKIVVNDYDAGLMFAGIIDAGITHVGQMIAVNEYDILPALLDGAL